MRHKKQWIIAGCVIAGFLAAPLVEADPATVVSMELTGVTGPHLGEYYTSPYIARVGPSGLTSSGQFTASNSSSIQIYCDDFLTDVSTGDIWQATVTNMSALEGITTPLTTLKFDTTGTGAAAAHQQQLDYMAEAWLMEQIAGLNQTTTGGSQEAGELSFAMWAIFDPHSAGNPGALSYLPNTTDYTAAQNDITAAYAAAAGDDPDDFSNVNIYTPNPLDASQEYLTITNTVPEPATLSLLGFGLAGIGFAARRRRKAG